jgi:hypothetical protein
VGTGKMPEVGPLGRNLAANVRRICAERGISNNKLSAELERAGRPIPPLGVARMFDYRRRTDVDELAALAQVLDVTPASLLAAPGGAPCYQDHPAMAAARQLATRLEEFLAAVGDPAASAALDRAMRRMQIETEEVLACTGTRPAR